MFKKFLKNFILFCLIILFCPACSSHKKYDLYKNINKNVKENLVNEISEKVKFSIKDDLIDYVDEEIKYKINIFDHPVDIELQKCINKDFSNAGMSKCSYIAIDGWNTEINRHLDNLKSKLKPEQFALIQESQAKWEEYKKKEVETLEALIFEHEGTYYQVAYVAEYISIVKHRAILLGYYDWIYSENNN